ncbi:hypothetical protein IQ259_24490 [Fortiea sp. LEGE XX443]|uniref:hypothetical protein n=1 Tax=Fortiea sp. LEGE XX443 TaxID=1828611 RepID=UPI0019FA8727|nr:hypothetical protein [Fortiea sp. LEGE XX443]MBE9008132.1 hypothetical protein [Fortiea sp. LEGE XX443]
MITQMMVQPSFWVESGIKLSKVRNIYLFKITEELQYRLEELSEKRKAGLFTSKENIKNWIMSLSSSNLNLQPKIMVLQLK